MDNCSYKFMESRIDRAKTEDLKGMLEWAMRQRELALSRETSHINKINKLLHRYQSAFSSALIFGVIAFVEFVALIIVW